MKISNVKQMREMDSRAIQEFDIPQEILMENAGNTAYFVILKELGIRDKKICSFWYCQIEYERL